MEAGVKDRSRNNCRVSLLHQSPTLVKLFGISGQWSVTSGQNGEVSQIMVAVSIVIRVRSPLPRERGGLRLATGHRLLATPWMILSGSLRNMQTKHDSNFQAGPKWLNSAKRRSSVDVE